MRAARASTCRSPTRRRGRASRRGERRGRRRRRRARIARRAEQAAAASGSACEIRGPRDAAFCASLADVTDVASRGDRAVGAGVRHGCTRRVAGRILLERRIDVGARRSIAQRAAIAEAAAARRQVSRSGTMPGIASRRLAARRPTLRDRVAAGRACTDGAGARRGRATRARSTIAPGVHDDDLVGAARRRRRGRA